MGEPTIPPCPASCRSRAVFPPHGRRRCAPHGRLGPAPAQRTATRRWWSPDRLRTTPREPLGARTDAGAARAAGCRTGDRGAPAAGGAAEPGRLARGFGLPCLKASAARLLRGSDGGSTRGRLRSADGGSGGGAEVVLASRVTLRDRARPWRVSARGARASRGSPTSGIPGRSTRCLSTRPALHRALELRADAARRCATPSAIVMNTPEAAARVRRRYRSWPARRRRSRTASIRDDLRGAGAARGDGNSGSSSRFAPHRGGLRLRATRVAGGCSGARRGARHPHALARLPRSTRSTGVARDRLAADRAAPGRAS